MDLTILILTTKKSNFYMDMEIKMKIKSTIAGLVVATAMVALILPGQSAWAKHCTGKGWHMVSKSCNIPAAETWQEYNSGIYTQPVTGKGVLFLR
jgi:hypothetical protein